MQVLIRLVSELHQEFSSAQFWEIDHPATQRHKARPCLRSAPNDCILCAMDLSATTFDSEALIKSSFDSTQRSVWIAEGLLMYLHTGCRLIIDENIEKSERAR